MTYDFHVGEILFLLMFCQTPDFVIAPPRIVFGAKQACICFRMPHGVFIAYTCRSNCSYMYKQLLLHV